MKKILFVIMMLPIVANAQDHVLDVDGDLYFIPASMTKYGESFLYSRNNGTFTIYDGNLNVIKTYPLENIVQKHFYDIQ